jgi:hypothetical protein
MNPQIILLISEGVELLATLGPVAVETALKIQQLLDTPATDFTVQIKAITDGAIASADDTLQMINDWQTSKGLAPTGS